VKAAYLCLPFLLMLVLSGCWSAKEANEIDYVLGVGVDKADNGDIILTIQSPDLSALKAEKASSGDKFKSISARGSTTFEALRNYINVGGQKLFWGHIQICIIGEHAARDGVEDFLDFFSSDPELRGTSMISVVKGKAKDVMEARVSLTPIPSDYLSNLLTNATVNGKAPKVQLVDFNRMLTEPIGSQPYLPLMELMSQSEYDKRIAKLNTTSSKGPGQSPVIYTGGTAVFRGTKLKGFLDEKETRGLMWTKQFMKSALIAVKTDDGGLASLELIDGVRNKVSVKMEGDTAVIKLTIHANLNIGDRSGSRNLAEVKELKKLEEGFNALVKKEVEMAFEKAARKFHSDIFSFGNALNDKNPKVWNRVEERWEDEILPNAKLDIEVKGTIRRTSRTLYTPWAEEK
jgi:spore germination protein KC